MVSMKQLMCPSCGSALGKYRQANEVFRCQACNSTLVVTDWRVDALDGSAVHVITEHQRYAVTDLVARGDLCNVYLCGFSENNQSLHAVFKIARDPADNDLVRNEGRVLQMLAVAPNYADFNPFLPRLLDTFIYQDESDSPARQVNIIGMHGQILSPFELYSLEEVRAHYAQGIHPKDMAWMWRRLLSALGFAHVSGFIHGAVLPPHVMIEPRDHKLVLIDWSYAVNRPESTGERISAISTVFEAWYPPEVLHKQQPRPGLDLLMAARCMMYAIGADMKRDEVPNSLEPELQQYFERCIRQAPDRRPQDAFLLLREFDTLIEKLWGPRTFRAFAMPPKQ